jgi:hypothetical protein
MKFWKQCLCILLLYPVTLMTTACTQAQVDAVLSDADLILQTADSLGSAIGAVSPADAAALSLLTGVAIAGVNSIKATYDTYEANKTASNAQNVIAAAQAIQTNLPQELAALHIVSTAAVAKATVWVTLVVDTAAQIVSRISGLVGATRASIELPTPESLKARWTAEVCLGDAACGDLVKVHHKHLPRKVKL